MNRRFIKIAVPMTVAIVVLGVLLGKQFIHHSAPQSRTLYGDVDIREIDLAFRQSGRLTQMLVDEGDRVHAGQILAQIDPEPLQEALDMATANTAQARAGWDLLRHGNRPEDIAEARQQLLQAKAQCLYSEQEYRRQKLLQTDGTSSIQQLEAARASRDSAQAAMKAAEQHLHLLQAGARSEDIAAAKARWQAAQAVEAQARTALADTTLKAPADAIIFTRVSEPGSMITPAQPVYVLSVQHPIQVRAYITESDLGQMHPGRLVWIRHDGTATRLSGHISFVSPRAEFTPKTVETADLRTDLVYRIRITIDQPDSQLRQGMPVTVDVPADHRDDL